MRVSRGGKVAVLVIAGTGVAATPLYWLLGSPDAGQIVAASIQSATGIAALAWTMTTSPDPLPPTPTDAALTTGSARATNGATSSTGVRRPHGAGAGSAKAEHTGDAIADGPGSHASTGVDYS